MTIYAALLRGINVGGKNIIKMADLKQKFEEMGLTKVKTYIQSGNILFESDEEEVSLQNRLEHEIEATFGITVPVILRTADEIKKVANNCPFSKEEISAAEATAEGESLYVSFLARNPSLEGIEKLSTFKSPSEEYRVEGRDVYLLFGHSIRNSKLANNLQKIDVSVTTRNWKTINKLVALITEMEH